MPAGPVDRVYGLTAAEFRDFVDRSAVGIVVVISGPDPHLFANSTARHILGLHGNAVYAVPLSSLSRGDRLIDGNREYSVADWLRNPVVGAARTREVDVTLVRDTEPGLDLLASITELPPYTGRPRRVISLMDISGEKWLGQQLAQRAAQQSLAVACANALVADSDVASVAERACKTLIRGLGLDLAVFMRLDEQRQELVVEAFGGTGRTGTEFPRVPVDGAFHTSHVLRQRQTLVRQYDEPGSSPPLSEPAFATGIVAPVWISGEPRGVIGVFSRERAVVQEHDVSFVEGIALMISNSASRILAETQHRDGVRALERARAAERLDRAARLSSLGTMAGGIAHELKNPINAIHMNAELADLYLERDADRQELADCLAQIRADCQRAAEIADSILNFARGDEDDHRERTSLGDLLESVSRLTAGMPGIPGDSLEIAVEAPELDLEVGRTEVEQAILNLVQNAFEAGATQVRLAARAGGPGQVEIEVVDNGPGIPEALLPKIFDPFFTTRDSAGGSGLGLSLVHRIFSDHGGDIDVTVPSGGGCRFRILLPARDAREAAHS